MIVESGHTQLPVVIPAAGLGLRFRPLTDVLPKELLPLAGRPLIHHALREVERAGFHEAIVVISPRKRAIREYFEGDRRPGVVSRLRVRFVEAETRGPGDALLMARRLTGAQAFGVLLPDDVILGPTPWQELERLWRATGAGGLCVRTFPAGETGRFGVAECDRHDGHLRVRRLTEKPRSGTTAWRYRIFGRYIASAAVLEALDARLEHTRGELQLTDGYVDCLGGDRDIFAVEFDGDFFDCGTPDEYAQSVAQHAGWESGRRVEAG